MDERLYNMTPRELRAAKRSYYVACPMLPNGKVKCGKCCRGVITKGEQRCRVCKRWNLCFDFL